jgi:hypothetical protein
MRYLLIVWVISLPAIIFQLGINIFCDGQTTDSIAPIPPPRADDTDFTIPGCEVLKSIDCLVAKTAFKMPEYCKTYATTVNCVTYLTPAFCEDIDLPAVQNDTTPLQNCIDAVPFGPCYYNTTGRACTSRLFSAFKFLNDSNPPRLSLPLGGGPGREFEQQLDTPEVIFGGELDHTWNSSVIWRAKYDDILTAEQKLIYNVGEFLVGTLYLTGYLFLLLLLILHRYIQERSKYYTRTCQTFT